RELLSVRSAQVGSLKQMAEWHLPARHELDAGIVDRIDEMHPPQCVGQCRYRYDSLDEQCTHSPRQLPVPNRVQLTQACPQPDEAGADRIVRPPGQPLADAARITDISPTRIGLGLAVSVILSLDPERLEGVRQLLQFGSEVLLGEPPSAQLQRQR